MKYRSVSSYILMHGIFFMYSFYTVLGKSASEFTFLSPQFCALCSAVIIILAVYAVCWQQVLKRIELSVAMAHKAATIIWGMIWGCLFFNEEITPRKIIGAAIISAGILVLSCSESSSRRIK
ncbi:MAG: EamA family transporter [Bacteroides sp.]|nr:EamA family transporter [Prevotella sp.]MCM1407860.1 EamA family transporter [Treponema brennaborense]MCM1469602.1 EamA family transporter [Bacteroides sp.]